MSEHFTFDELAELDEGMLARRRAAAAERHLAECEECAARADALRKTKESLHDLEPVRMPRDVAARLDRALRDAGSTSAEDVVPDLATVRARRFGGIPPWAYGAAAAVIVLAGVGIGIGTTRHHHRPTESASGVTAPLVSTTAPPQFVQQESGQTYSPATLAQLAPALSSGRFAAASGAGSPPGAVSAPNQGTGLNPAASPTTHKQADQTNGAPSVAAPSPALAAPPPVLAPSLRRLADSRDALLACAAFITDTPHAAPLAVDFGRWSNKKAHLHRVPAVVFVFADPSGSHELDVYVVAASCGDTSLLDFLVVKQP
ncbi:MAG: hypothetical protein ACTHK4_03600 [Mycobacteriales bacterium]